MQRLRRDLPGRTMNRVERARARREKEWCYGAKQAAKGLSKHQRMLRSHRIQRATRQCQKCKREIPLRVWLTNVDGTDNGLELLFDGGYAEFIDAYDGPERAWLCHECAHDLADWLGMDVRRWHTHSLRSGQHPDHHPDLPSEES